MAGSIAPTYSGSDRTGYAIAPAGRIVWRGYSISTSSVARASSARRVEPQFRNRPYRAALPDPRIRLRLRRFDQPRSHRRARRMPSWD